SGWVGCTMPAVATACSYSTRESDRIPIRKSAQGSRADGRIGFRTDRMAWLSEMDGFAALGKGMRRRLRVWKWLQKRIPFY
ncbi:MAG: hypothetical protein PUE41_04280, partial [bacterium]|nr:hypothetical protein [bacterium]